MATSIKRKLQKLRDEAKNGSTPSIRERAMAIYRKRSDYITKEDLLLFGILIKKTNEENR